MVDCWSNSDSIIRQLQQPNHVWNLHSDLAGWRSLSPSLLGWSIKFCQVWWFEQCLSKKPTCDCGMQNDVQWLLWGERFQAGDWIGIWLTCNHFRIDVDRFSIYSGLPCWQWIADCSIHWANHGTIDTLKKCWIENLKHFLALEGLSPDGLGNLGRQESFFDFLYGVQSDCCYRTGRLVNQLKCISYSLGEQMNLWFSSR